MHLFLSLLFFTMGCGDDDAMDPPSSIAREDYALAIAEAYCRIAMPCCEPVGDAREDCVEVQRERAEESLAMISPLQRYDPDAAAACIAALNAAPTTCPESGDALTDYREACADVVNGTVDPGGACEGPADCLRGEGAMGNTETGFAGCAEYGGSTERRCRRFSPTTNVGDACEEGFEGSETEVFVCAGNLRCVDGECADAPADETVAIGDPCTAESRCLDGRCDEATLECVPLGGSGDACTPGTCGVGMCLERVGQCLYVVPAPLIGFAGLDAYATCE